MRLAEANPADSLGAEYLRMMLGGTGVAFALYWLLQGEFGWGGLGLAVAGMGLSLIAAASQWQWSWNASVGAVVVRIAICGGLLAACLTGWYRHDLSALPAGEPFVVFSLPALALYLGILIVWNLRLLLQPLFFGPGRLPGDVERSGESPGAYSSSKAGNLEEAGNSELLDAAAGSLVEDEPQLATEPSSHAAGIRRLVGGLMLGGLLVYMVLLPTAQWLQQWNASPQETYALEEESLGEIFRIHSAKVAIFAIFVAIGASFGSFLNVVAESLPSGRSIALRSSACPQCEQPIRRVDNLPIISYLLLGGRCRSCQTAIPLRYLLTELTGAGLFAAMFIGELVSGAANLPGVKQPMYTGIVWIILYTKWNVVAVTAYHLFLFCTVMTAVFAQVQRLSLPLRFWLPALLLAIGLPTVFPDLMPLKIDASIAAWLPLSNLSVGLVSSLAGLAAAVATAPLLGQFARRTLLTKQAPPSEDTDGEDTSDGGSTLSWSLCVLGAGLGWQATVSIVVLCVAALLLLRLLPPVRHTFGQLGPTALLFLVALAHQLAWQSIFEWTRAIWSG
ncbi:prepilin peptidase [Planctomycetaceae bacterium SH139]